MRILIYGAGVIGSLYAALFSKAGYEVSVYARGRRLQELNAKGLLYRNGDNIQKADVTVLEHLSDQDCYTFVFLTVRTEQAEPALYELQSNISPTIVTMINTIRDYAEWEAILGVGRLLPAFPGAGGSIVDGVLDAALTPALIQPTTFARSMGSGANGQLRWHRFSGKAVSRIRSFPICTTGKSPMGCMASQKKNYRFKIGTIGEKKPEDWIIVEGTHEAIVTAEEFEIVQQKLKARQRPRNDRNFSLFAGLIKCGKCGKALTIRKTNAKQPKDIYACWTYNRYGNKNRLFSC